LWPASSDTKPDGGGARNRRIAATYDYTDELGVLLYQVVRYEPKGFRQRRPDPARPGDWLWNMDGVRRVLYRLPEVNAALKRGEPLYITEGEKDADALGLCATTSPGGAGKWRDEYAESLRGAEVVVVADKDAPGRAHAQTVARSCSATARMVKVLELPGAHVKDASDWLSVGGAKAELERMADEAPDWAPVGVAFEANADEALGPEDDLRMRSWREIELRAALDPPEHLVDEILMAGDTLLIHGYTGAKKSITALELALAIERATPFLGHVATRRAHVGICDEESEERRLGGRLPLLARGHDIATDDDVLPVFAVGSGLRLDTDAGIERIYQIVRANGLDVLIVDTLIRVHQLDENVARDMAVLFMRVRALKRRVHDELGRTLTVILIHHAPKPRPMGGNSAETMARGSGDILGQVDTALYLRNTADPGRIVFEFSKNRWGPEGVKFLVTVEGGDDRLRLVYAGEAADALGKGEQAHAYIVSTLIAAPDQELPRKDLLAGRTVAKVAERTLVDALKAMKEAGEVETRLSGRAAFYRLTEKGQL